MASKILHRASNTFLEATNLGHKFSFPKPNTVWARYINDIRVLTDQNQGGHG